MPFVSVLLELVLTGQRNQCGVSTLYDMAKGGFPAVFKKWSKKQVKDVKTGQRFILQKTPVGFRYATHLPVAHVWTGLSSPICDQYQKDKVFINEPFSNRYPRRLDSWNP